MNTFIFQSMPDRYDLRTQLIENQEDTWYATRYRNEMKPGDIVYFWMGGDEKHRGLYGWGKIISEPYIKDSWESFGIDVKYKKKFEHHIPKSEIEADSVLSNLLLLRAPMATNFLLDEKESKYLNNLVNGFAELPPPLI